MDNDKKIRKYAQAALAQGGKPTLLDRLRGHFFSGGKKKLTKRDEEMLAKYNRADQLLSTGYSQGNCAKMLQTELGLSQAQAYRIIKESLQLFGDVRESSKKSKAHILEEMYMLGAAMAKQMNDMTSYFHALDSIARLNGMFDTNAVNINMNQLSMPKLVMLDNDLETLKNEMDAQTIEIEPNE